MHHLPLRASRGTVRWLAPLVAVALLAALSPAALGGSAPAHDDFAAARSASPLPYSNTTDTEMATPEAGEPSSACSGHERTVWYRFKPSATMTVAADTIGSAADTSLAVFKGTSLATLVEVDCNGDINANDPSQYSSRVAFRAVADQQYYIRVSTYASSPGGVVFHLQRITPPANDAFGNATTIRSLPFTTDADNTRTTLQVGEPRDPDGPCSAQRATRWYRYTPSVNVVLRADTFGAEFDTVLGVYTGSSIGTLQEVVCNDDTWYSSARVYASSVTFRARAGTTYHFQVGGYDGEHGELPFRVRAATPLANDQFANAEPIVPGSDDWSNTRYATFQPGEVRHPETDCEHLASTAWYRYGAESTSPLLASVEGETSDLNVVVAVYRGSSLSGLTLVGCGSSVQVTPTVAGEELRFQVAGTGSETGPIELTLELAP